MQFLLNNNNTVQVETFIKYKWKENKIRQQASNYNKKKHMWIGLMVLGIFGII